MSDQNPALPLWGPAQMELLTLMTQAIDPEERISSAMQAAAPIADRLLLDVGAGVGDRTILYARLAEHVYALESNPTALPILRGRVKSSMASNVTIIPASTEAIPLDDDSLDVAYATWAYFFGPGSEPGLREVERVIRPGGDILVVQNYGHDELACIWTPSEAECETWPTWFEEQGFRCQVVDTFWRFDGPDEALAVLEFLWGERARAYVLETGKTQFGYKVAVYHRRLEAT
jgi:SAM-dependent methyltransferase